VNSIAVLPTSPLKISALFPVIMQRRVVIVYRRFGTKYPSHLQV
jgi:hypothetical protein